MNWRKSGFSPADGECAEAAGWRTASYSVSNGQCVEIGIAPAFIAIRDTQNRCGTLLAIPAAAWAEFVSSLK